MRGSSGTAKSAHLRRWSSEATRGYLKSWRVQRILYVASHITWHTSMTTFYFLLFYSSYPARHLWVLVPLHLPLVLGSLLGLGKQLETPLLRLARLENIVDLLERELERGQQLPNRTSAGSAHTFLVSTTKR